MSPDGHGGVLAALRDRGMLEDMATRGLDTLFYFQVDNPLVDIADPAFIGLHCARNAEASTKVCAKRDPEEGLGVVVERAGRNAIVEYTELTREQKRATVANGELKYNFGSVAIHTFSRAFLAREALAQLPLHLAHKKVPCCDDSGKTVEPEQANAYKFEKFIFDTLPRADRWINLVFEREQEFSPVKNAGGNDSPDTARRDMMRKFTRMLEACGVHVPVDSHGAPLHRLEIAPTYALDARELKTRLPRGFRIEGDTLLA
jgi:UDP-N-acetylglucosamine/UDP-N-acetylgalactosamine diphosphorylase